MQPMATIRAWHIDQMREALTVYRHIIINTTQADASTYRDGDDGWTVVAVMCHLRDFEAVFYERARLTLEHDQPDLPFPDPDVLASERDYAAQDLRMAYDAWAVKREAHLALLQAQHDAANADLLWERAAKHPTRGDFTLHDQLFLTVRHDMMHLAQMGKILAQR